MNCLLLTKYSFESKCLSFTKLRVCVLSPDLELYSFGLLGFSSDLFM